MMAALLRGATIDTILSSFTCEGSPLIKDAMTIPSNLDDALVDRLAATPDETHRNWMLFHFLAYRASDQVLTKLVRKSPDMMKRLCWVTDIVEDNPKMASQARVHGLGLLDDELREQAALQLESYATHSLARITAAFAEPIEP